MIERDGSDANVLIAATAACADEVTGQLQRVAASLFLDSATGRDLDRLVFDRTGLTRKPASQALCSVTFQTVAPNPAAFNIPKGTKVSTADGREFITWVDAVFPTASTGPIFVEVRSVLSGLDQSARKNTINSISSQITGQPSDLTVTNPVATVGADDEEADASLRDRARRFFTTARRATLGAIEFGALAVAGIRSAFAFENLDVLGRPAGSVQLIVTDAFTESFVDTNPPSYQAQSQTIINTVSSALEEYRAAGVYVQVHVASVVLQPITLALRFNAGTDVDLAALNARGAIAAFVNSLLPGQDMLIADLITALRAVNGLVVTGAEILSPVGDVIAEPLEVLRTSLSLVVATTVQPDVALQGSANPDGVQ